MTTIGPWQPEVETLPEYIARLVSTAPPLTPEEVSRLSPLLRLGSRGGSESKGSSCTPDETPRGGGWA